MSMYCIVFSEQKIIPYRDRNHYHVLKGSCHDTHHVHHVGLQFASLVVHLRRYLVDHGQEVGSSGKGPHGDVIVILR